MGTWRWTGVSPAESDSPENAEGDIDESRPVYMSTWARSAFTNLAGTAVSLGTYRTRRESHRQNAPAAAWSNSRFGRYSSSTPPLNP